MCIRDSIVLYAESVEKVEQPSDWSQVVSYFSTYSGSSTMMGELTSNFLNLRDVTAWFYHLRMPLFVFSNQTYYRVHLAAPVSHYCYLPLVFPPEHANVLASDIKLCTPEKFEDLSDQVWFAAVHRVSLRLYQWYLRHKALSLMHEDVAFSLLFCFALGLVLFRYTRIKNMRVPTLRQIGLLCSVLVPIFAITISAHAPTAAPDFVYLPYFGHVVLSNSFKKPNTDYELDLTH
eukprot:TRINITY_DN5957_c0_g1_i5.p1 TRINITY_DN5957_c0_g1~~TRINITY_DN5957_c0_g1_i5.p1  ORF type:complete len:233 (-),score=40.39 TRINITY_DN5957_c0_g1_i5:716-1414(-)